MRFFDRLSGLFRREPMRFSTRTTGPSYTPAIDRSLCGVEVGRVVVRGSDGAWIGQLILDSRVATIRAEIARLRRNKKKHSHLQKELDALISGGASSDQEKED